MSEESTFYKEKYEKGRRFYDVSMPMVFINRAESLLNEYFGMNYGYFSHLFEQHAPLLPDTPFYSKPYEEQVQELRGWDDKAVKMQHIITIEDFNKLFTNVQVKDGRDNEDNIIWVLYMLAHHIVVEQIEDVLREWSESEIKKSDEKNRLLKRYEEENYTKEEAYAENKIREDLLTLYIFLNEPRKWPSFKQGEKITMKFFMGNIDINNNNHWFARNVLGPLCQKYIPEITSIEQAEDELYKHKKRAGRPSKDPRIMRIVYGIFRMFNEKMEMHTPLPDSLCEFIIKFLEFLRLIDEDSHIDNQWIRAQITHVKKKPTLPKFPFKDFDRTGTIEQLKEPGRLMELL